MIEAKDKEQAVLQLYRTYGLGPVDEATLRPPGWRGDKTSRKKKAVPADVDDGSDEDLELVDGGGRARAKRVKTKAGGEEEGVAVEDAKTKGALGAKAKRALGAKAKRALGDKEGVKADNGEAVKGNAKGKKATKKGKKTKKEEADMVRAFLFLRCSIESVLISYYYYLPSFVYHLP